MIDIDTDLASFCIGEKISKKDAEKVLEKQIQLIDNGKWFIVDFIDFQCGELSEGSPPHRKVIGLLKKHSLWLEYRKGRLRPKEEEEEEEEKKEEEKEIIYPKVVKDIVDVYFATLNEKQRKRFGKNIEKYWDVCDKLIRLDGFTEDEIRTAIINGRRDDFWRDNFLSFDKLRKKSKNMGVKYIEKFLTLQTSRSRTDPIPVDNTPEPMREEKIKALEKIVAHYEKVKLTGAADISQYERMKANLAKLKQEGKDENKS